jgi:RNA polymerase sigma-70 factor (family 1)
MIDKNDFKALFDKYYESLRLYIYYKIAAKDAADDMAQDVFMTVWEKRKSLDMTNTKALLYKIAAGLVVDYYRKSDIKADFSQWVRMNSGDDYASTNEQAEYKETMQRYAEALNSMPEGQREVFLMNREEQLTYREIAERLNLSVKAVEKRITKRTAIIVVCHLQKKIYRLQRNAGSVQKRFASRLTRNPVVSPDTKELPCKELRLQTNLLR